MKKNNLDRIYIKLKNIIGLMSSNYDTEYAVKVTLMILINIIDEILKEDYEEFERTLKRNE